MNGLHSLDSVALDGDTAVFTTLQELQLFTRDPGLGWIHVKSIPFPATAIIMPHRVELSGDLLVAGAGEGGGPDILGEVRVWERGKGYDNPIVLSPTDAAAYDNFGASIALHGSTLVVGASQDLPFNPNGPGKVYVFEREGAGWVQAARIVPSHSDGGFGFDVAFDGSTLVVGAPGDPGKASVYERTPAGWLEIATLSPPNPGTARWFGSSVAVDGDTAMVAASGDTPPFVPAVHAFTNGASGWVLSQVLPVSTVLSEAIDLEGDRAVIGSPDTGPTGAVLAYERSGGVWVERGRFTGAGGKGFGQAVDLDGNRVLASPGGIDPGHPLVSLGIASATGDCAPGPNSTGQPAELSARGCDSALAGELSLLGRHLPPGELAVLYLSRDATPVPFGNDLLCLGAPEGRVGIGVAGPGGSVEHALDFDHGPGAALEAGSTWRFQIGFRDGGFGAGLGASNALEIPIQP